MTDLRFVRILAVCLAAIGALLTAAPASACESSNCQTNAQTAAGKPLRLSTFKRQPVATSAVRSVKKKNGEYARVAIKTRSKHSVAAPTTAPQTISPAAAQAFASYELARVRVVTPEEASLLTEAGNATSVATAVVGVDNVQVVRADEINDIDRRADSPRAVSLDALSRDLAGNAEPKTESEPWLQRMLIVLGGAFAAVAALMRTLLG